MTFKILVVDNDKDIIHEARELLNGAGYACSGCYTGEECLHRVKKTKYDLIILEAELPDMNGTDLCRQLKYQHKTADIPVVFISSLSSEVDKVVGLSLGATDYILKPFSWREFVLRIKAILRRTTWNSPSEKLTNGVVRIDLRTHAAWIDDVALTLTKLEFKLLSHLIAAQGRVLRRDQIIESVWGVDAVVLDRTVDAHIRTLRKKMGPAKCELETVQGVGYRICQHQENVSAVYEGANKPASYTNVNELL